MTGDGPGTVGPATQPGFGLPRAQRLTRPADYQRVYRNGGRIELRHLIVRYLRTDQPGARFGLAVSRKVGNAVVRNRVKRWIREATRHERGDLAATEVVFIARSSAANAGAGGIRSDVARALRTLGRERRGPA